MLFPFIVVGISHRWNGIIRSKRLRMAVAITISKHWIGITLDSQIWSDWITLIMWILDGSILSVHEPERQTVDGVNGRAVIGNGCENPHLVEEVNHFLCSL